MDPQSQRNAIAFRSELERVRQQWQGNEKRWLGEIDHLREEAKRFRGEHDRGQKALLERIHDLEQQLSIGVKEQAALRVAVDNAERELGKEREARRFAEGALSSAKRERGSARGQGSRKGRGAGA